MAAMRTDAEESMTKTDDLSFSRSTVLEKAVEQFGTVLVSKDT